MIFRRFFTALTSLIWPDRQHDMGQPLLAQGDGIVAYVGLHPNAGTYLDIDYGDVAQHGDLIGLIGDTGHAHLHLQYWDSREMEVAEGWRLRNAGCPQTEITFNGSVIEHRPGAQTRLPTRRRPGP